MNAGTQNIEVVHIGFHYLIISFFTSEGRGRKSKSVRFGGGGGAFFRYKMSLESKYFKDSSSTINLLYVLEEEMLI